MSLTRTDKIKCDGCGAFISYQDLADGKAIHTMTNPSAYGCEETFESECAKCYRPALSSADRGGT